MISFLLAMDQNRTIGKNNDLPWRLPADLAYFRKVTMGHTIVMGRKTYESIGRPLPGRENVVVTKNTDFQAEGCFVVHSVEEAKQHFQKDDEVFVIGGAQLFEKFFPYADRLYITLIEEQFEGDTYFQNIDKNEWNLVSKEKGMKNEKNPYDYCFLVYARK
jgi:dihydrofolate reductase